MMEFTESNVQAVTKCRRMLHPVMVVKDIKEAQEFYNKVLGMKTLRYRSFPDGSANGFSGAEPCSEPPNGA